CRSATVLLAQDAVQADVLEERAIVARQPCACVDPRQDVVAADVAERGQAPRWAEEPAVQIAARVADPLTDVEAEACQLQFLEHRAPGPRILAHERLVQLR